MLRAVYKMSPGAPIPIERALRLSPLFLPFTPKQSLLTAVTGYPFTQEHGHEQKLSTDSYHLSTYQKEVNSKTSNLFVFC